MFTTDEQNINQTITTLLVSEDEEYFMVCRDCNSKDLKVRTVRRNKSKYYHCKNCKKSSSNPIQLDKNGERLSLICPFCDTTVVRKGRNKNKKQRYRCSKCHKYTITPKVTREKLEALLQRFCRICKSIRLKKKGFDRYGKQIYYCHLCEKHTVRVDQVLISSLARIGQSM